MVVQFSLSIEQIDVWSVVSKKHSEANLMVQKFISFGMIKMITYVNINCLPLYINKVTSATADGHYVTKVYHSKYSPPEFR